MFTGFSLHEKSFDFKSSEIYVFLSIYKHIHLRMEIESRYRIFSVITCFCHGKRWCIVCSPICEIKLPLNLQTVTKDSLKYGKMSTKSGAYLLFVQDQCQIVISVKNTQTYMRKKMNYLYFEWADWNIMIYLIRQTLEENVSHLYMNFFVWLPRSRIFSPWKVAMQKSWGYISPKNKSCQNLLQQYFFTVFIYYYILYSTVNRAETSIRRIGFRWRRVRFSK